MTDSQFIEILEKWKHDEIGIETVLDAADVYSLANNGAKPIISQSKCDYHAVFTFCGSNGVTYCSNCGDPV